MSAIYRLPTAIKCAIYKLPTAIKCAIYKLPTVIGRYKAQKIYEITN